MSGVLPGDRALDDEVYSTLFMYLSVDPLPMSTLRPPDVIHVIGVPRPSPFFMLFRFRVLYWMQTEEQKMGEAWERGYEVRALFVYKWNSLK